MKRLNLRNSFALALLFALLVPMLAACGGATTTPPAAATSAPAADAPTAVAAPTAAAADAPTAAAAEAPTAAAAEAPTAAAEPTGESTAKPGILRINVGAEGDNYDPQQASFVREIQTIMLNWQALMTFDLKMNPIPGQAESVDVSEDGKLYTFKLRPNAKFSNGDPLTAANYEYAWKRLADPELAGQYQFIGCDVIKGFSEYAVTTCADSTGATKTITEAAALDLPALREGVAVKAVDDNTLTIELVNPAPYFLSMAALWIGVPVREDDAASVTDLVTAVPEHYIGNGPFMLTEHEQGTRAVWEANPNYQGPLGPVKLKGIEMAMINESAVAFQAYKNGELDIGGVAAEDLAAVQSDPVLSKEYNLSPGSCTFYLGFNTAKPPFDNIKVRQAFAQAFDREAWVRDVFQGLALPTQTFIPPGFPGYEKSDKWAFNPEAAKKTLAEAGFAEASALPPIKLTFSSSARNKVRFEWVANQLKQNLGVEAQLDPVDPTAYTALVKEPETTPQMFYLGWCADYPDPQDWLTLVFKTGGSSAGRVSWSNKEFDDLVTKADIEPDAAKRAELYSQAQEILIEEAPVAFTSNDVVPSLIKPHVKGISKDTITPLDYIPGFFNLKELDVVP
jgi:oligopeptide transport system substrate-binding protein